jgi:serpin B
MNRLLVSAFTLWLLLPVLACGPKADAPNLDANILRSSRPRLYSPNAPAEDVSAVSAGNTALGLDLLKQQATGRNTFFSPYSLSLALAMAYHGANGETQRQMATALHFLFPPERLAPALDELDLTLASHAQNGTTIQVANAAWVQGGFAVLPSYLDALAEFYGAGVGVADFHANPSKAAADINSWAGGHTTGRIPQLVDPSQLTEDIRLVLANALYFKGSWKAPFDPAQTAQRSFHQLDGTQVSVPMMSVEAGFGYARGNGCDAVELPYLNGAQSMVIVLPDSGTFSTFVAGLDATKLGSILSSLSANHVRLLMPKFTVATSLNLGATLQAMGMTDAFSDHADFSGIDGSRNLSIAFVVQKAFVNVNESGTEAAAATAVGVGIISVPMQVAIDRPFLFFIRDIETGTILFIGQVVVP